MSEIKIEAPGSVAQGIAVITKQKGRGLAEVAGVLLMVGLAEYEKGNVVILTSEQLARAQEGVVEVGARQCGHVEDGCGLPEPSALCVDCKCAQDAAEQGGTAPPNPAPEIAQEVAPVSVSRIETPAGAARIQTRGRS